MAEALVTSVLEILNSIVVQPTLEWLLSARQDLEHLSHAFAPIQAVIYDAERRKGKEKALSIWLERLKDVAHDLGDLLDECKAEDLKAQIEGSRYAAPSSKIFGPANKLIKLGTDIEFGARMGHTINDIKQRLNEICNERNNLHLKENVYRDCRMDIKRTSSMIDESGVFGKIPNKERVVKMLLGDMNQVRPPAVISIVGMDGLGKTTLTQLAYNDQRVIQHFEIRIWVHVSSHFNVWTICNAIAEAATRSVVPPFTQWEIVQNNLKYVLQGKRFLLVLDDVWNTDPEEWEKMRLPLEGGACNSRIIIITCDDNVVKAMRSSCIHHLHPLPEEDCQSLFNHLPFSEWREEESSDFEHIGREIVKKCEGVPLIVKRFASAVRFMGTTEEWRSVLNSETWDVPSLERGRINIDLLACYDNMPTYLKQCFAFCSIFSKDHVLEKDTLIQLWMSQGFILPKQYEKMKKIGDSESDKLLLPAYSKCKIGCSNVLVGPKQHEKMERIGERYFRELLGLSLFEDLTSDQEGRMKHCKLKDIVHYILRSIKGEYHIINTNMQIKEDVPLNARNVALICSEDVESIPSSLYEVENLSTLMIFGWSRIVEVSSDLFYKWKWLRSLDMSGTKLKRLPNSLGNLKLLKYLNLSTTEIEELPESVSSLLLLQTLKLNECRRLRKLAEGMRKLVSLRHLEIKGTSSLEYLPKGIGNLTSLLTLSKFIANNENGSSIEELGSLDHLEGELDVVNLDCIPKENSGWKARINKKKCIDSLALYCSAGNDNDWLQIGDDEKERVSKIFLSLVPHRNLKELTICNYSGYEFPEWLSDVTFPNLTCLRLVDCHFCKELPDLRLLGSLKQLEFDGMHNISNNLSFYPKLETLIFRRMLGWVTWHFSTRANQMPAHLIQLRISECPRLTTLPSELGQFQALESLFIEGCPQIDKTSIRAVPCHQSSAFAHCWVSSVERKMPGRRSRLEQDSPCLKHNDR